MQQMTLMVIPVHGLRVEYERKHNGRRREEKIEFYSTLPFHNWLYIVIIVVNKTCT